MGRRMWITSFFVVALALGCEQAPAQTPPVTQPLDSGTLVRVHLSSGARLRGRLLARFAPTSDRIVFCRYPGNPCADPAAPGIATIPATSVARIDVAAGNRAALGAVGGALGIVAGALLGNATIGAANDTQVGTGGVLVGAALGAVIGALAGSTDIVWRRVA